MNGKLRRGILGAGFLFCIVAGALALRAVSRPDGSDTGHTTPDARSSVPFPPEPMEQPEYVYRPGDIEPVIVFYRPGVRQPPAVSADQARLPDHTRVIGVVVDGKARAYVASAMSEPTTHVVNDRIGGKYVSVAFCDVQQCATAYRANDAGDRPLELWVAGWDYDEMVLLGRSGPFRQKSDPAPYPQVPCVLTTWGQWRREHPDTNVVVRLSAGSEQPGNAEGQP